MEAFEQIEILLVEDNPRDAELTMRALKKGGLANQLLWVKDGQQALDYLFRKGEYAGRGEHQPRLVLLERPQGEIAIVGVVLDQQHLAIHQCSPSVNDRVAPRPGAASAHTRPPCRSTMRCQVARPIPVPSNSDGACSRWNGLKSFPA